MKKPIGIAIVLSIIVLILAGCMLLPIYPDVKGTWEIITILYTLDMGTLTMNITEQNGANFSGTITGKKSVACSGNVTSTGSITVYFNLDGYDFKMTGSLTENNTRIIDGDIYGKVYDDYTWIGVWSAYKQTSRSITMPTLDTNDIHKYSSLKEKEIISVFFDFVNAK